MEESSKVRLVRCPKCEKLLPELPDYSVYQCGGCGVFLRAKKKANLEVSKPSERPDEGNVGGSTVSEKPMKLLGKSKDYESSITSDTSTEFNGIEIGNLSIVENEIGKGIPTSKPYKLDTHVENGNVVRKSDRFFEGGSSDIRERDRFGSRRSHFEEMRPSSSNSNYVGQTSFNYGQDSSYKRDVGRGTRVEDVEPDRDELLRKLEELQDQLSRVNNNGNNNNFRETYAESDDYFREHPSTFNRVPRRSFAPNNQHFPGEVPFDQYHEPYPLHHRSDMGTHGYHIPIHGSNFSPRYEDHPISRRPPPPPQRVQTLPSHGHHHYINPELDHFESHPSHGHHLSCSCYRCYDQHHQVQPPPVPVPVPVPVPYHRERRGVFGSQGQNPKPPLGNSCEPKSHKRWSSDPNPERNGLAPRPPQRGLRGKAKGHRYLPIASGAPFVTCTNCFELLKLPKKAITKTGLLQMSCAACSSVISFAIVDEKLVSVDLPEKQTETETVDTVVNEIAPEYLKRDNVSYCSEDYSNSGFDFQEMDRDPSFSSTCHSLSSRKSEETHSIHSVSAATSEDERLSPQRVMTIKNTLREHSFDESVATEMEISSNEYPNRSLSKLSSDKSQEDDQVVKGKRGDSFFAGILKKSFRSNSTGETVKKNVVVNGNVIPDKLVKKAEKLAGPVYPGQYWYDYRAGFWGTIGGPCLGIVPPLIKEFKYPMPEKCGAGNTGVFVNGRELHQRDLELLSSRGLPASKDRSYIVDITGKVVDEDTGEEVVNLGKLAPTVEKVKHGFGMRPKEVA